MGDAMLLPSKKRKKDHQGVSRRSDPPGNNDAGKRARPRVYARKLVVGREHEGGGWTGTSE